MARCTWRTSERSRRFPHPRGDGPVRFMVCGISRLISPPTWGWPAEYPNSATMERDFPTHVGMARGCAAGDEQGVRFPHPRGDGPRPRGPPACNGPISPPTWGWPGLRDGEMLAMCDFPTHVGMARHRGRLRQSLSRFPHPRGDGPARDLTAGNVILISPPTWGWPATRPPHPEFPHDFPTHVGMARPTSAHCWRGRRFPHPRGDGPT